MNEPKADTGAISDFTTNAYDKVSDGIDSLKNTVSSSVADYSSQSSTNLGEASKEFLQSNGIIAKVVFVFFVIIMFNIILRLGMFLITYLSTNDPNPYLIEGLIQGSQGLQVKQDPKDSDSVTVLRSNNQTTGIEFSWSVWLFINDLGKVTEGSPNYSHIFHKGINSVSSTGIANINRGAFGSIVFFDCLDRRFLMIFIVCKKKHKNSPRNINRHYMNGW
jgi:hypothetical protein